MGGILNPQTHLRYCIAVQGKNHPVNAGALYILLMYCRSADIFPAVKVIRFMKIVTLSDYLKREYGQKMYKLSLSSGCTCPNRDGTLGTGGCSFCSEGGSGEFAEKASSLTEVDAAIARAVKRIEAKLPGTAEGSRRKYIAYFQSYTNTYGDTEYLRSLYTRVLQREDIAILSVGTRPDCIGREQLQMLCELNARKPIWVELGLQTIHDKTAERIHRGYETAVFRDCYHQLKAAGLTVIVHVILGLPGESREDMLDTVRELALLQPPLDGIKLQMLNILRGSGLAREYLEKPFPQMSMEEYTDLIADCLQLLPEETVIHRMTGDGPQQLLISPMWAADKKKVLNMLNHKIAAARREQRGNKEKPASCYS
jgi:uncharacterized protein